LLEKLNAITVPASKIKTIREVVADPWSRAGCSMPGTRSAQRASRWRPAHTTAFIEQSGRELSFPPRFGQHNPEITGRARYTASELSD